MAIARLKSLHPTALNLEALSFSSLRLQRNRRAFQLPVSAKPALAAYDLLLANDANGHSQLWVIEGVESHGGVDDILDVQAAVVFGQDVTKVDKLYFLPASKVAPLLLNAPDAPEIDEHFPLFRLHSRQLLGHTRLESANEEAGLELLLSILLNARGEGRSPVIVDPYGVMRRMNLPALNIIELGRTHAFSVEDVGLDSLVSHWISTLPAPLQNEAWQEWGKSVKQGLLHVKSLKELEELFLSKQSNLLYRAMKQFSKNHLFSEGAHQELFSLHSLLKESRSDGNLLIIDISHINKDVHDWVWRLLLHGFQAHSKQLENMLVANIHRHSELSEGIARSIQSMTEQGLSVINLHPECPDALSGPSRLMGDLRKQGVNHLIHLSPGAQHLLFMGNSTQGVPLRFKPNYFESEQPVNDLHIPHEVYKMTSQEDVIEAMDTLDHDLDAQEKQLKRDAEIDEAISSPWTDVSSFPVEASDEEWTVEEHAFEKREETNVPITDEDDPVHALLMTFEASQKQPLEPVPAELSAHYREPSVGMDSLIPALSHDLKPKHLDPLERYSSILGKMPDEWRDLIEREILSKQDDIEAKQGILPSSEGVHDHPHAVHPCLPESMLEDVTPYLDDKEARAPQDPNVQSSPIDFDLIASKKAVPKTVHSKEDGGSIHQRITDDFDPYHVPESDDVTHGFASEANVLSPMQQRLSNISIVNVLDGLQEAPKESHEPPDLSEAEAPVEDVFEEDPIEEVPQEECFYDELLTSPLVEDEANQRVDDQLPLVFMEESAEESLIALTKTMDARAISPIVTAETVSISTPFDGMDAYDFDLNLIQDAMKLEYAGTDLTALQEEHDEHAFEAGIETEGSIPAATPSETANALLSDYEFNVPSVYETLQDGLPSLEETLKQVEALVNAPLMPMEVPTPVLAKTIQPFPDFDMPEDLELSEEANALSEAFAADINNVPLHSKPAQPPTGLTPPNQLDAVPVAHAPIYEAPSEAPEPQGVEDPFVQTFEKGMRVQHATYGSGNIQAVVDMQNRVVLSILFDEAGKRLIDPSLTELTIT